MFYVKQLSYPYCGNVALHEYKVLHNVTSNQCQRFTTGTRLPTFKVLKAEMILIIAKKLKYKLL